MNTFQAILNDSEYFFFQESGQVTDLILVSVPEEAIKMSPATLQFPSILSPSTLSLVCLRDRETTVQTLIILFLKELRSGERGEVIRSTEERSASG
jgi:hypothetical protein